MHYYLRFLLFSLILLMAGCREMEPKEAHLGKVRFEASGAPEALQAFQRGLLLLHSFEYEDAREAFEEARDIDSTFAMAYWGAAMTHNHPLWRQQDYEEANKILASLAANPDDRLSACPTPIEKDLMQAVNILYGEGSKLERDQAYSAFMEGLYAKYPEMHEIAAFYALSLLGAVPVGRDETSYEQGAAIARGILEENPEHPGALHYLIHSYDDPSHARLALGAANSYAKVAPDAAHALHMPSHIYVAMGMWNEVVTSNIASWNASVRRMLEKELDNDARSYHALHWLMYGYLQRGEWQKARDILADMHGYMETLPSKTARAYLIDMKGNYLMETNDWTPLLADIQVDREDLNIVSRTVYHFVEGMKAFRKRDAATLDSLIQSIEREQEQDEVLVTGEGVPMCGAANLGRSAANRLDLEESEVMQRQLRGLFAWLEENDQQAGEWLASAVALQDSISYSYGPPEIVKPSYELYGEWLLRSGKPAEALQQFEKALERGPKRIWALQGVRESALQSGDRRKADETEAILREILAFADQKVKRQFMLTE